ncbi:hypothetical protein H8957_010270 [Semnopithecus entellus]
MLRLAEVPPRLRSSFRVTYRPWGTRAFGAFPVFGTQISSPPENFDTAHLPHPEGAFEEWMRSGWKERDLTQQARDIQDKRVQETHKDNSESIECSKITMDLKFNNSRKYISITVPSKTQAMSPHIKSIDDIVVLGMNLSKFNKLTQFFICVAGVFVFYLIYGYLQELIFSVEGFKSYGWYLTLVQFAFYSIFGLIELQLIQDKRRRANTKLGGYLHNEADLHLFYTGKRYNVADVSAAICMSLGLIWFTLADSTIAPNFNLTGVVLISLALCADAVIGNVQEKAMKLHNASNSEMVLYSYSIGFVYILLGLTCTSGLGPAVTFCAKNPIRTYGYAFLFSLTGYFGISFVLALIKIFGALIAVTVTTGRKAMTIVLSFIFFAKPFTFQYVWSGFLVVLGIFLNVYSKNMDKIRLPSLYDLINKSVEARKSRTLAQTV